MIRLLTILIIAGVFGAFALDERSAPADRETLRAGLFADSLSIIMNDAKQANLPLAPLENKIREGRAKQRSESEILAAVRARKALLEQLREKSDGSLQEGYARQLFTAERKSAPVPSVAVEAAPNANSGRKHGTSVTSPRPVQSRTARGIKVQNATGKNAHRKTSACMQQDKNYVAPKENQLALQPDTNTVHAEKTKIQAPKPDKSLEQGDNLEKKAAKKAELKEKALEKRIEKSERRTTRKQP